MTKTSVNLGENFGMVEKVWSLRDEGLSYGDIDYETVVSSSTAQRIVENRKWYLERGEMVGPADSE